MPAFSVEAPRDPKHGDFAVNAAMVLAKAAARPPREVAQGIIEQVRAVGVAEAAEQALRALGVDRLEGFWIHLDADVLDDAIMPAVDYRMPGGLGWDELSALLRVLTGSGAMVGINIGIFNPRLDADGSVARRLAACLVAGLMP